MRTRALLTFSLVALSTTAFAAGDYYQFLDRKDVGAAGFTKANPTWDGRGVVVAILDTGVDPSVPGLQKTSDGKVKVIEARDFSGEGDVKLAKARLEVAEGVQVLRTDDGVVRVGPKLPAAQGDYWLGFFDEADLAASDVSDVNGNGKADSFAVVGFATPTGDRVLIDTDGDGDLNDEKVRQSYKDDPTWFSFATVDPKSNQSPVAFTVTTRLADRVVEIHFDDGGHGTHCAGISTGFGIHGRAGYDGIAPGAQVMSLKIGHNALAGGATTSGSMKNAIDYASTWAKDHKVPVVMNISYGIGSEHEGMADIDAHLDTVLAANPLLSASVSAGNEGPGLSTVGTPAASHFAWTAGAALNQDNARALWGGKIKGPRLFQFSSRGGELAKPDGVSPGVAWSTVPPFMSRSVMAGTSMAAPQAAGVHALLISAAQAQKVPWTSAALKRALRTSAKRLKGYTSLDQGAGMIRVGPAFKALKEQRDHKSQSTVLDWRVETEIPTRPGATGSGSYWRVGGYLPGEPQTVPVVIEPTFFADVTDRAKREAFDVLSLDTDAGWLDVDRGRVAIQGETPGRVALSFKPGHKALKKPGLHVAHLIAELDDVEAFRVPVAVIVPWRFEAVRKRRFVGKLGSADVRRFFVAVPPGATSMSVTLTTPAGLFGNTWLKIHDPEGRPREEWSHRASSEDGQSASFTLSGDDLTRGTWEFDLYSTFRNRRASNYELSVSFHGLELDQRVQYEVPEDGNARASVMVTNRFHEVFRGNARAVIDSIQKQHDLQIEGDRASVAVTVGPQMSGARLRFEMSPDDYHRFTDIAISVTDSSGETVAKGGFGNRFTEIDIDGPGEYEVAIVGGTTHPDPELSWLVLIEEIHKRKVPYTLDVTGSDGANTLYPDVSADLDLEAAGPFQQVPDGFHYRGALRLTHRKDGAVWLNVPLTFHRD